MIENSMSQYVLNSLFYEWYNQKTKKNSKKLYILENKYYNVYITELNIVYYSTDISCFSKEFFSKANKIKNFKKNKKNLKKLLTNNNIYYIINT
jgi:hypothetical protein